jgi:hypothetical protein
MYPISIQARECRQYAEQCARSAQSQSDPQVRQSYLEMQKRWLGLASSYEFSEQLEFLSSVELKNRELRSLVGAHRDPS